MVRSLLGGSRLLSADDHRTRSAMMTAHSASEPTASAMATSVAVASMHSLTIEAATVAASCFWLGEKGNSDVVAIGLVSLWLR